MSSWWVLINAVRDWAAIVKGEERLGNELESSRADWHKVKDWTRFRSTWEYSHSNNNNNPGIMHQEYAPRRSFPSSNSKGTADKFDKRGACPTNHRLCEARHSSPNISVDTAIIEPLLWSTILIGSHFFVGS